MKLYIDGNHSLVKQETIQVARRYNLEVVIVMNMPQSDDYIYPQHVTFEYINRNYEASDYCILSMINKGDILITQDYSLASLIVLKTIVINDSGRRYTIEAINSLTTHHYILMNQKTKKEIIKSTDFFSPIAPVVFTQKLCSYIEKNQGGGHFNKRK